MLKRIFSFSNLTLLVALTLSTIAAWYSIIGLTTIFAGAVVPVIIMGSALELAKITTTVWLRKYWHRAGLLIKLYLVPAVMAIALITSMGIFGFLSKAHMDQGITSGDVQAKVAIYDEKIKTAKENIDVNRKALKQLDEAVDQVMGRSTDEKGADKAVAIRRGQAKDRQRLLQEISAEQKTITQLTEERAPIAAEVRKVEAEVGPIKYIAALLYGDNPDANILERAVRWVIILLVIVFDPLALMLVLAANQSKDWDELEEPDGGVIRSSDGTIVGLKVPTKKQDKPIEDISEDGYKTPWTEPIVEKEFDLKDHPYLFTPAGSHTPPGVEPVGPQVYKPEPSDDTLEPCYKCGTPLVVAPGIGPFCPNKECDVVDNTLGVEPIEFTYIPPEPITVETVVEEVAPAEDIITEGVTKEHPWDELDDGFVTYKGKTMSKQRLMQLEPKLFMAEADHANHIKTNFGTQFPKIANRGDIFVRVDTLPNRVYKFEGSKWIAVNKDLSSSYLNKDYIQFLINKVYLGEYDLELLSEEEKAQIKDYLNNQNS
jgi:hypothetical protein